LFRARRQGGLRPDVWAPVSALPRASIGVRPGDVEPGGVRRELKDRSAQGPTTGGNSEARARPGGAVPDGASESPSLILIINDTKLLMSCVKCFELGISNTCDEGVCGKEWWPQDHKRDGA
jgi:hypothetical protein